MELKTRQVGGVCILDSGGDLGSDIDISWAMHEQIQKGRILLLLNLEAVSWISSEGIGQLVAGLKRARGRGGDLKLLRPSREVARILAIVGLDRVFEIFQDESEALRSFGADPSAGPGEKA